MREGEGMGRGLERMYWTGKLFGAKDLGSYALMHALETEDVRLARTALHFSCRRSARKRNWSGL
jgi:hypothetical protein